MSKLERKVLSQSELFDQYFLQNDLLLCKKEGCTLQKHESNTLLTFDITLALACPLSEHLG